jgi:metacaspase-1
MKPLTVLGIHGIGNQEATPEIAAAWQKRWKDSITEHVALGRAKSGSDNRQAIQFHFLEYDALFEAAPVNTAVVLEAFSSLSLSGITHSIGDIFSRERAAVPYTAAKLRSRGFSETLRWYGIMVAQWTADESLRDALRLRLRDALLRHKPDIIVAHSLGTLIAYDTFAQEQTLLQGKYLITLGSQIGNPFVRSTLGGRIVALKKCNFWFNLYNVHDDAFVSPIDVKAPNFKEIATPFNDQGMADHDAAHYLSHVNTSAGVWNPLTKIFNDSLETHSKVLKRPKTKSQIESILYPVFTTDTAQAIRRSGLKSKALQRKALLIGINEYPNPQNRLEGCVNDVFRMSEILQENGYDPENIRVLLNERATSHNVKERLSWLLEDAEPQTHRFLYYSGHGAQIPSYGKDYEVDKVDECLVTYDFQWTRDTSLTDKDFVEYYSQLDFETQFIAIFDCCHSGGMTRDGAGKCRGINPPDDILHRSLAWNAQKQMWIPRTLAFADKDLLKNSKQKKALLGSNGATIKLGRGVPLWSEHQNYEKAARKYGHMGLYMPLVIEACNENEFSYEYKHGPISFGAFTWVLSGLIRKHSSKSKRFNFEKIVAEATSELKSLHYQQTPQITGPKAKKEELFIL